MLKISEIGQVSNFIRQRAQFMWAQKLKAKDGVIVYRVRPYGTKENRHKHPRIVTVNLLEDSAECVSRWDGTVCDANSYGNLCCHVYRTLQAIAAANERTKAA